MRIGPVRLLGLGATLVAVASGSAQAWDADDCTFGGHPTWVSSEFEYRTSTTDFPTSGDLHAPLEATLDEWDAGSGEPIRGGAFTVLPGSHTSAGTHSVDGQNTLTLESLATDGEAFIVQSLFFCTIDEVDIAFDSSNSWNAVPAETESETSITTVGMHEVGHALGLNHENDFPDTMNGKANGSAQIGEDDMVGENSRVGVRALYPGSSTGTDIALSSFRFAGNTRDGVAIAERIPVTDPCGSAAFEDTAAAPGESVSRCFCIHALGTTTESSLTFKLYISTNSTISTADTLVGTWNSISVGPNTPYCPQRSFTVPSISSGNYFVGAIVDPSDSLAEYDETNNTAVDGETFHVN